MQGFNMGRYYPPDSEAAPSFNTPSSLRATMKRTAAGTQTVRFEMPFHVWCGHCPRETIIPQGVRFNAEKKKVGNYFSTPIFSFRMKHTVCGGSIEIRTDPEHADYIVYEGGKKRDFGEDQNAAAGEILSKEERERRRDDAFAALEGKKDDEAKSKESKERVEDLFELRERDWKDPYKASQRVRRNFRQERKVREQKAEEEADIREKYGLEMDIHEASETDILRAKMVDFGQDSAPNWQPLFKTGNVAKGDESLAGMTRREKAALQRKSRLQDQLRDNTRAALDPFLPTRPQLIAKSRPDLGIKRSAHNEVALADAASNTADDKSSRAAAPRIAPPEASKLSALVDYDTDSD